jgi:hypothetical protein
LGEHAPKTLTAVGAVASLAQPKTALFCSVRCPGEAILRAYDTAQKLRDEGVTVVSGFHSPVEKECLRILLRGKQPIIICFARSLEKIEYRLRGAEGWPLAACYCSRHPRSVRAGLTRSLLNGETKSWQRWQTRF